MIIFGIVTTVIVIFTYMIYEGVQTNKKIAAAHERIWGKRSDNGGASE